MENLKSKNIPASHVKSIDVPFSEVVSTEAIPEQSTLTVLAMKAIPVAHIQPVMATEAIFEHPALPVTAMEAVPKQPVVTAAEAFSESLSNIIKSTRKILANLNMATKYEVPEVEPPESSMEEVVSKSAPDRAVPKSAIEEVVPEPAAQITVPETAPERAVPELSIEEVVPKPAPERAGPESAPVKAVS